MIVGEEYQFGFPPRGNMALAPGSPDENVEIFGMGRGSVTTSNYSDQDGAEMFGLGQRRGDLPWENTAEVFGLFGLGDGDGGCSCSPINIKNSSMVILGAAVAYYGLGNQQGTFGSIVRFVGGAVAAAGGADIIRGFMKKNGLPGHPAPAPASVPAPVPQAVPDNDPSKNVSQFYGLGSEWYRNDPTDAYLNRFANALRPKCGCGMNGIGQCYSCIG